MKISVIIPTYKPQAYIWECLDSLCAQTFPKEDYEVILVLNGCKEPYYSQIEEYLANHPQVQWNYIQTDKGGVSNARNIALDNAKGDYITFIDDDDIISQSYLEKMHTISSYNTISICHPQAFIDGNDFIYNEEYTLEKEYYRFKDSGMLDFISGRRFFQGPCMKLIHREIIGNRRFDVSFKNGEDSLFMFAISNRFSKISFTTEDSVYYRRIRKNSANSSMLFSYRLKNSLRMILKYFYYYFHNITEYNLYFFITRIFGAIKTIFFG